MFSEMEPRVALWSLPLAFGISVGIGVIFGLYPARAAARLDPISGRCSSRRASNATAATRPTAPASTWPRAPGVLKGRPVGPADRARQIGNESLLHKLVAHARRAPRMPPQGRRSCPAEADRRHLADCDRPGRPLRQAVVRQATAALPRPMAGHRAERPRASGRTSPSATVTTRRPSSDPTLGAVARDRPLRPRPGWKQRRLVPGQTPAERRRPDPPRVFRSASGCRPPAAQSRRLRRRHQPGCAIPNRARPVCLLASPQLRRALEAGTGSTWRRLRRQPRSPSKTTDRPSAYHYRDFVIQRLEPTTCPTTSFAQWLALRRRRAGPRPPAGLAGHRLSGGRRAQRRVDHRQPGREGTLRRAGRHAAARSAPSHARTYDRLRPLPRPQVRPDPAARLLPHAGHLHDDRPEDEVELDLDPAGTAALEAAFDAEHVPFTQAVRKVRGGTASETVGCLGKRGVGKQPTFRGSCSIRRPMKSKGRPRWPKLPDGSILATGTNPQFDTYTFVVPTRSRGLRCSYRSAADPSLVKGAPAAPPAAISISPVPSDNRRTEFLRAEPSRPAAPQKSLRARRLNKPALRIAAAIDDNDKSGWAVDPQIGKNQSAVFDLDSAAGFEKVRSSRYWYSRGTISTFRPHAAGDFDGGVD